MSRVKGPLLRPILEVAHMTYLAPPGNLVSLFGGHSFGKLACCSPVFTG